MINVDGWMLVLNLEVKENDLRIGHLQQRTMELVTIHYVFFLAKTAPKSGQALNQMIYGLISRNYKNRMISTL